MPLAVSIHAFRGEGDPRAADQTARRPAFQSTPSGGKATAIRVESNQNADGFNPRLPGGRRREVSDVRNAGAVVSIHAFRGEGDDTVLNRHRVGRVSIHAFRGEGDALCAVPVPAMRTFQSTPSGGKATSAARTTSPLPPRFNPRLPGGRRLLAFVLGLVLCQA